MTFKRESSPGRLQRAKTFRDEYERKRLAKDIDYLKYKLDLVMKRTRPKFDYDLSWLRDEQETLGDESRDKSRVKSAFRPNTSHTVSDDYSRLLNDYGEHKKESLAEKHLDNSEPNKAKGKKYELLTKEEGKGSSNKPLVKGKETNKLIKKNTYQPKASTKHTTRLNRSYTISQSLNKAREQEYKRHANVRSKGNKSSEVVKTNRSYIETESIYKDNALTGLTRSKGSETIISQLNKDKVSSIEVVTNTSGDKSNHIESIKKTTTNINEEGIIIDCI